MKTLDIKRAAKERGVSINALSEKLSISRQTLHAHITGNPTINVLSSIASALGCEVTDLFYEVSDAPTADTLQSVCPHCGKAITVEVNVK